MYYHNSPCIYFNQKTSTFTAPFHIISSITLYQTKYIKHIHIHLISCMYYASNTSYTKLSYNNISYTKFILLFNIQYTMNISIYPNLSYTKLSHTIHILYYHIDPSEYHILASLWAYHHPNHILENHFSNIQLKKQPFPIRTIIITQMRQVHRQPYLQEKVHYFKFINNIFSIQ